MKIAFTSKGSSWDSPMDPKFGRTDFFLLFDEETEEVTIIDNTEIQHVAHGAGPKTAQKLHEHHANVLITGNGPGNNAAMVLKQTNIAIYTGAGQMRVNEAFQAFKDNRLTYYQIDNQASSR